METARTAIPISEADLLVFREKAERSISRINGDQDIGAAEQSIQSRHIDQRARVHVVAVGRDVVGGRVDRDAPVDGRSAGARTRRSRETANAARCARSAR